MTNTNWNQLIEDHEAAYFRGDLAVSSPESYSLEELKEISDGMFASTAEVEAAMRADFESLPGDAKLMLLDMLGLPGTAEREWWERILLDFDSLPDAPTELA